MIKIIVHITQAGRIILLFMFVIVRVHTFEKKVAVFCSNNTHRNCRLKMMTVSVRFFLLESESIYIYIFIHIFVYFIVILFVIRINCEVDDTIVHRINFEEDDNYISLVLFTLHCYHSSHQYQKLFYFLNIVFSFCYQRIFHCLLHCQNS